jgi:hypothetical protein
MQHQVIVAALLQYLYDIFHFKLFPRDLSSLPNPAVINFTKTEFMLHQVSNVQPRVLF